MLEIDHRIHIAGTGSSVPAHVVSNEDLEGMVRNYRPEDGDARFSDWVDRVSHIRQRRFLHPDHSAGMPAREACLRAIEASGVPPRDIGLFIFATFTTKNIYPGEETMLSEEMGLKGAATFYLTAACAGGIYGLHTALAFLRAGIYRHALVVASEHLSAVVDFGDPITAILFGDGAGAAVLSRRDHEGAGGVVTRCVLGSSYAPGTIMMENMNVAPLGHRRSLDDGDGVREYSRREYLRMEGGPRVLRNAVNIMAETTVRSLGFTPEDLKRGSPELREHLGRLHVIPHQANGRIIDGLRDKLGIPDERMYKTIYHYGNISGASNLITLDYAVRRGNMRRVMDGERVLSIEEDVGPPLRTGDLVAVPTVGAGYRLGCFTFVHEAVGEKVRS
ncbi:MAG: ketoacyl-ACP synthase III [Planctomycetes bacterium]|nr:ketoacyl-ACP synthase III [Planctomycetota bacterium]